MKTDNHVEFHSISSFASPSPEAVKSFPPFATKTFHPLVMSHADHHHTEKKKQPTLLGGRQQDEHPVMGSTPTAPGQPIDVTLGECPPKPMKGASSFDQVLDNWLPDDCGTPQQNALQAPNDDKTKGANLDS